MRVVRFSGGRPAEEAAMAEAIDRLMTGYRSTSSELSAAIEQTLTALSGLLTAAATHRSTTQAGLAAARIDPQRGGVPGHGQLLTPAPEEVIGAVVELAYKQIGMRPTTSYPHLTI